MAARGDYPFFPGPGAAPGLEVVGRTPTGRRVLALPAPDGLDAIGIGLNALVAELALHRARVSPGDRVLVRGAGGGIGVLAVQIARARGALVTAVTSSPERAHRLRDLGATEIVDRTRAEPGGEHDVVVDTVAGPGVAAHLRLLAPNGRYALCGGVAGDPGPDPFAALLRDFHRSPTVIALSLNSVAPDELARSWERVLALAATGALRPVVRQRLPLDRIGEALRLVGSGRVFGKVVVRAG
ncbi:MULTISPECIES: zinc-binding dehydrogenase [Actinosynnema]|uniref:quinone oxidoreductase family protein n=1 Tax=Actinosynnema TaxID=40566 RepID=UPI0020A33C9D|nr:zinc-binding dehydrogenase [Actinosynnema pretiosum]MCP2096159.1 Zinc-binding dehydrogenase [Actinosynnema pretiosum]